MTQRRKSVKDPAYRAVRAKKGPTRFEQWPMLPEVAKRMVIGNLSFEDRNNIRQCSTVEMKLVDKIADSFDKLRIFEAKNDEETKQYLCLSINRWNFKVLKTDNLKNRTAIGVGAVTTFCRIFANPRTTAKCVELDFPYRSTHRNIMPILVSELARTGVKIRAKELWVRSNQAAYKWIGKVLKAFEPGHLEKIAVGRISGKDYAEIKNTEQFKACKQYMLIAESNFQLYKGFDGTFQLDLDAVMRRSLKFRCKF